MHFLLIECPVDTGRKLDEHKTFRIRPRRLVNVLSTFNLRPVSTGAFIFQRKLLGIKILALNEQNVSMKFSTK